MGDSMTAKNGADSSLGRREFLAKSARWALAGSALPILAACGQVAKTASSGTGGGSQPASSSTGTKAKYTIKFGSTAVDSNPVEIGYQKFAQLVGEKTKGDVQVQLYCCNQLGNDQQLVTSARSGAIQMGTSSNNNLDAFTSKMEVFELPFLIQDAKTYIKVWDGPVGQQIKKEFEDQLGIKILMVMDAGGFRDVMTTKRAVHAPGDLHGLKLRVAQTPIELATFRLWGADPAPLAYNEVFTALQQGTVDGEVLQPVWFYSDKHYEVAKVLADIHYVMLVHIGFINLSFFKELPSSHQNAIVEAAQEAQAYEYDVAAKAVADAKEQLIKSGVNWYTPAPSQMDEWEKSSQPVWDQFKAKIGADLIKQVESLRGA